MQIQLNLSQTRRKINPLRKFARGLDETQALLVQAVGVQACFPSIKPPKWTSSKP
jgi:hypothetical protein